MHAKLAWPGATAWSKSARGSWQKSDRPEALDAIGSRFDASCVARRLSATLGRSRRREVSCCGGCKTSPKPKIYIISIEGASSWISIFRSWSCVRACEFLLSIVFFMAVPTASVGKDLGHDPAALLICCALSSLFAFGDDVGTHLRHAAQFAPCPPHRTRPDPMCRTGTAHCHVICSHTLASPTPRPQTRTTRTHSLF